MFIIGSGMTTADSFLFNSGSIPSTMSLKAGSSSTLEIFDLSTSGDFRDYDTHSLTLISTMGFLRFVYFASSMLVYFLSSTIFSESNLSDTDSMSLANYLKSWSSRELPIL